MVESTQIHRSLIRQPLISSSIEIFLTLGPNTPFKINVNSTPSQSHAFKLKINSIRLQKNSMFTISTNIVMTTLTVCPSQKLEDSNMSIDYFQIKRDKSLPMAHPAPMLDPQPTT